jgi:Icc-related predicted phosphoesterase
LSVCFFVSDLHGHPARYRALFGALERERPGALFLGGDLFPHALQVVRDGEVAYHDFLCEFLIPVFERLREDLGPAYPRVFLILGNDDGRSEEAEVEDAAARGLWVHAHERRTEWEGYSVYGYAYVPPTPFLLKDWERYDVGRYVAPGCVSPEEGYRTVPVPANVTKYATIKDDLDRLAAEGDLSRAIFLFHSPPYDTVLDRAGLDGKTVDHAPLDVHVGSVAIRRFIERRQPLVTLHGHVHESARLSGTWREQIGRTHALGAAHTGPELALIRFDPADPGAATRELL